MEHSIFRRGADRLTRRLISCLTGAIVATASIASSNAADHSKILVVETMELPIVQNTTNWLIKGLGDFGHKPGESVDFSVINAEGDAARAESMMRAAIANNDVDLVVTVATLATRAARKVLEGKDIPQVFVLVADPVAEGIVPEIGARSEDNTTGTSHVVPTDAKLKIVAKSLPKSASGAPYRIGLLYSTYPSAVSEKKALLESIKGQQDIEVLALEFPFVPGEAGKASMLEAAQKLIRENEDKFDGLWLATGPNGANARYVQGVQESGKPIVYAGNMISVRSGAMLTVVSTPEITGLGGAAVVDAVLRGTRPNDIPVTRSPRFAVGVNLETAKRIGTVIPSAVLMLAGSNVFN